MSRCTRSVRAVAVVSAGALAVLGCMGVDPGVEPTPTAEPFPREPADQSPDAIVSTVFAALASGQPIPLEDFAGSTLRNRLENSEVHAGLWLGQAESSPAKLVGVTQHSEGQFWVRYTIGETSHKALWTFDERGGLEDIAFADALLSVDILGGPPRPFKADTLCRSAETHVATCDTPGGKRASICENDAQLRYRFGRPDRIEMSLPARGTQPLTSSHRAQGPETLVQQVHARLDGTAYTFVVSNGEGEISGRITVRQNGRELTTLYCTDLARTGEIPVVDLDPSDPRAWAGMWGFEGPILVEANGRVTMQGPHETQPVKQVGKRGVLLGSTDCSLEFELHPDHRLAVAAPEDCGVKPPFEGVFDRMP